jgi:AcrR family transcriptional regulator
MPKGFSEREKEIIRSGLIEKGKQFFATTGIKKTNVDELARAVGISKGAFYLFYSSKEALFFEILEQFETEYQTQLLNVAAEPGKSPRRSVKDFLIQAFSLWRTHVLFTHFDQEDYEHLLRKLPEEQGQLNLRKDEQFTAQLLDQWNRQGVVVDCDPKLFANLIRALFFISLHKRDFDKDVYPDMVGFFVDLIVDRVVKE